TGVMRARADSIKLLRANGCIRQPRFTPRRPAPQPRTSVAARTGLLLEAPATKAFGEGAARSSTAEPHCSVPYPPFFWPVGLHAGKLARMRPLADRRPTAAGETAKKKPARRPVF